MSDESNKEPNAPDFEERRQSGRDRRVNQSDRRSIERVGESTNRRSGEWDRRTSS